MRLRAIASALPEHRVSAEEVAEWVDAKPDFIRDKVGVDLRYFLGRGETGVDLAAMACRNLFDRSGLRPEKIKLLVYVTQNPDHRLPHNSALLQHRLGLGTDCAAFDVNLGCSGYVYTLSIAKGFMASEGIDDALIVTCDPYSKIMHRGDKATVPVFGDGATATWMSSEAGARIGRADLGTDGGRSDALIVPAGGAARPALSIHDDTVNTFPIDETRLHMNGRGVFDFVVREIPSSIQRCLDRNDLSHDDISHYALHQGSLYMLQKLVSEANLPSGKVPINIGKFGNTVSSSVPMVLEEIQETVLAAPATHTLISGFGVGLSWATNVIST